MPRLWPIVLLLCPQGGWAAQWRVDPSGAGDFTTVQAAIDAAADGDEISIAEGLYTEALTAVGRDLTLVGDSRGATAINALGASPSVLVATGSTLTLRGLTFGNVANDGLDLTYATVMLDDVDVSQFSTTAVLMDQSTALFTDSLLGALDGTGDVSLTRTAVISADVTADTVDLDDSTVTDSRIYGARTAVDTDFVDSSLYGSDIEVQGCSFDAGRRFALNPTSSLIVRDTTVNDTVGLLKGWGSVLIENTWVHDGRPSHTAIDLGASLLPVPPVQRFDLTIRDSTFERLTSDSNLTNGSVIQAAGTDILLERTVIRDATGGQFDDVLDATLDTGTSTIPSSLRVVDSTLEDNDGGLRVTGDATVRRSTFNTNRSGVLLASGDILVTESTFFRNTSVIRSGTAIRTRAVDRPSVTVRNSVFTGNNTQREGGAIHTLYEADVTVTDSYFDGNVADEGGAIYLGSGASLTSRRNTYDGNRATDGGGGAIIGDGGALVLDGDVFNRNYGLRDGGAVYYDGLSGRIDDSVFTYNTSDFRGGALYLSVDEPDFTMTGSVFCGNDADRYYGGAVISTSNANTALIEGTVFAWNTADRYAGLSIGGATTTTLRHVTSAHNSPRETDQPALVASGTTLLLDSVAIVDNPGTGVSADTAGAVFTYSNFFGNLVDVGGVLPATITTGFGNVSVAPEFTAATGDCTTDRFTTLSTSGMVDAGNPARTDLDGSRADIGAFGGQVPAVQDGDADGYWSSTDCDDGDATVHPGATETWYDGVDQDCDGASDYDADGDGADSDQYGGADCDDTDPTFSPTAPEVYYDGIDQNCDGVSDFDADEDGQDSDQHGGTDCDDTNPDAGQGFAEIWYDGIDQGCDGGDDYDQDGDGQQATSAGGTDCDDTDATVGLGFADVLYDGIDSDCDGADDFDGDGDGFASDAFIGTDCDDTDATIHPGAHDPPYDGVDSDCDGWSDFDADRDGHDETTDCDDEDPAVHPGADEVPDDGIDQDCDGGDLTTPDDSEPPDDDDPSKADPEDGGCGCTSSTTSFNGLTWIMRR